jgi:hypothetical protein
MRFAMSKRKEDLKPALLKALTDQEYRASLVKNALELAGQKPQYQREC